MAKDADYIRMIHTSRWTTLRRLVLTESPLCSDCRKRDLVRPASEVHHITPVEHGLSRREKERLMFNPGNLVALCHDCHVARHVELGRSGKEATRRRNAAHAADFRARFFGDSGELEGK